MKERSPANSATIASATSDNMQNKKTANTGILRTRNIRDKILMTTEDGSWISTDKENARKILSGEIPPRMRGPLEEKGMIITAGNQKKIIEKLRNRYRPIMQSTSLHIIVPTLKCNQKCVYCHSSAIPEDSTTEDMDINTAKKTLEFIFQSPSKNIGIEFQGGEPLLKLDTVKHIVEEAKKSAKKNRKNLKISLVTNLTMITEDMMEWSRENKVFLCTSLDGPAEVHDANRKYRSGSGTHSTVTANIKKLRDKKLPIGALMVTTRKSLGHGKEIINEYARLGFRTIQLKYLNRMGYADEQWDEIGYPAEEFIEFWKKSMEYIIALNKKKIYIRERNVSTILKKILGRTDPDNLDFRSPCGAVYGQMAYNPNGDIFTCDEGRGFDLFRLGNVHHDDFKTITRSEKAKCVYLASLNENYNCDFCAYKPYCGHCPVLNYAQRGNIITNLARSEKCKIRKAQFDYVFEKLIFDKEARKIFESWIRT